MNKSATTTARYGTAHPSWCDGGHHDAHHERTVDTWHVRPGLTASVRITWTDTIDDAPAIDGPLVQVDTPEHLELADARRLAVALALATAALDGELLARVDTHEAFREGRQA